MKKQPEFIESLALIFKSWENWGLKGDKNKATLNFAGLKISVTLENDILTTTVMKDNEALETQEVMSSDIYEAARKTRFIASSAYQRYANKTQF